MRGCACRGTAGFAHVSCLAEQAKILVAEAEEDNLDEKVFIERFGRWSACSLCEQDYHGVVRCALGWACWKTYVGRPEVARVRQMAMNRLGSGLYQAGHYEEAASTREAELAMLRRLGASEDDLLATHTNLANTYAKLGRHESALCTEREVYAGRMKLNGEEHRDTLMAATNYAITLVEMQRFEEVKSVLRKMMPVARRVLGENNGITLRMRWNYATALWMDAKATLDDLRAAVTMLEDIARIMRRVFGILHPHVVAIDNHLGLARKVLRARETPPPR